MRVNGSTQRVAPGERERTQINRRAMTNRYGVGQTKDLTISWLSVVFGSVFARYPLVLLTAAIIANNVNPTHMYLTAERRIEADHRLARKPHCPARARVAPRDPPGLANDDCIVEKKIERAYALDDPPLQPARRLGKDHQRNEIERQNTVDRDRIGTDG
jgi:hypothetical protein